MTIAELLHHHGVHVPRYVTVGGRIVFSGVHATSSGFEHQSLGRVTQIVDHTFHGGTAESNDQVHSSRKWWDDEESVARHALAMDQCFPRFSYLPGEGEMGPCWGGEIDTGRGTFNALVMTRRDQGLPRVAVIGPKLGMHAGRRWVPSPHLYLNGNLCVAEESDWNLECHTVAVATGWAAHWLAAYTEWRFTKRWPADGVHAVAA
jgi:hypothetical protein